MNQLIFLEPVLKHTIWGGEKLTRDFGYLEAGTDLGECWGISAHEHGDCRVRHGQYQGMTLSALYKEHRELFGSLRSQTFPLLVKIIDAKEDLSIQVHPDDSYAGIHEDGAMGKTECWYVLDAPEGGSLVVGHHAKNKEMLTEMIAAGNWNGFIKRIPVQAGDFIQIEPGTMHAITAGVLLLETQQNSDITYRVYDYDREGVEGKRPLHIEKSLDVIGFRDEKDAIRSFAHTPDNILTEMIACGYYRVFRLSVKEYCVLEQPFSFLNLSVVAGSGKINGHKIRKGDHLIAPFACGSLHIVGDMTIIASTVPDSMGAALDKT